MGRPHHDSAAPDPLRAIAFFARVAGRDRIRSAILSADALEIDDDSIVSGFLDALFVNGAQEPPDIDGAIHEALMLVCYGMASEIWFESRELERENHALYVICAIMLLAEHSKGRLFTAGWSEFLATSVECALAWSQSGAMAFAEFLEWAENRVDDAESKCHFSLARAAIMASMAVKQCAKTSAQCDVERTEGHPAAFDCLSPRTAMRDDAVAEVWRRVLGRTDTAAEAIGLIRRVVGLNGNSTDEESGG